MAASPTTEAICKLWSDLLAAPVGPEDNFFELGGYSLLLLQMVIQAEEIGLEIAPEQVIDYPTPRRLAAALDADTQSEAAV
ncbi:phosphopantetheine-binding protein [Streptacidiphilus griseoplanus]|uniref:phosphopantetheine-binding protein n=1 Tax=Peterkaempfera griseoplana TaxID=66896 RepID=UPI0006E40EDD|nr:phosphopantetheine-binding protein [Peterkaempfera griseoplana]